MDRWCWWSFNPYDVKNHLEAVLPLLEQRAEKALLEFNLNDPKYDKVIKAGWFRKAAVIRDNM